MSHTRACACVSYDRSRVIMERFTIALLFSLFFCSAGESLPSLVFPLLFPLSLPFSFFSSDVTGVDASIYKARTFSATDAQGAPFVSGFIFFHVLPLHLSTPLASPVARKKALTIIGTFSIWIDGVNFVARARVRDW